MKYQYWLANIEGLGSRTILQLGNVCGSAEEIFFLKKEQLEKTGVLKEKVIKNIIASKNKWDLAVEYAKLGQRGISFYTWENPDFPENLKNICDAPYCIYVKGKMPDMKKRRVAIVGARMCSEYGREIATHLGKRLAECGAQVISGMARGIDSCGHIGALQGKGETFAVLGNGVEICYPPANRQLYADILDHGGLISEYHPLQEPLARLFPSRNRIISALSDMVILVEAKERSGSLITADFALEQGKDIFAIPGRITDSLSKGCNNLIYQGAGMIANIEDFLKDLEFCTINYEFQDDFKKLLLEKDESLVYSCLDLRPKNMEVILKKTSLEPAVLADILQRLVRKEFITETFKNYYIRKI